MPTDGIAVAALDLSLFPSRFSIFLERMFPVENVEEPLVFRRLLLGGFARHLTSRRLLPKKNLKAAVWMSHDVSSWERIPTGLKDPCPLVGMDADLHK